MMGRMSLLNVTVRASGVAASTKAADEIPAMVSRSNSGLLYKELKRIDFRRRMQGGTDLIAECPPLSAALLV